MGRRRRPACYRERVGRRRAGGGDPRRRREAIHRLRGDDDRLGLCRPGRHARVWGSLDGRAGEFADIVCDAAGLVEGVAFPAARPRVMHAERTFWEKATAIHVFCLQERLRGDRFARHWHDVVRLDEAGLAAAAFADRDLAQAVARHKGMFFAERAADRSPIDYAVAVSGGLRLVPAGDALKALEEDYARMVEDGLLLEDAEPFETLMARCADIAERANRAGA